MKKNYKKSPTSQNGSDMKKVKRKHIHSPAIHRHRTTGEGALIHIVHTLHGEGTTPKVLNN